MVARIIDRGRGPEIEGTRITVYDVMDFYKHGWHRDLIAAHFRLGSSQIQVALDYIETHKAEVMSEYEKIVDRSLNYQYSPEVQAKLSQVRGVVTKKMNELRAKDSRRPVVVTLLPDHDIEGQFELLVKLWLSTELLPYWNDLELRHESFHTLGISPDSPDSDIWKLCQVKGLILVTGNRNRQGAESLEVAIELGNTPSSLPAFTISAPDQFAFDPTYARRVAEKILDYVSDLDRIRGTGRLFVP